MSAIVVVQCDDCRRQAVNWSSRSIAAARDAAEREGWVRVGRKDCCPVCADKIETKLHVQRLRAAAESRRAGREGLR